jgi:tetratricopeptide (TPR) repeat protein
MTAQVSSRRTALVVLGLLVVTALAVGRFLTFEPEPTSAPATEPRTAESVVVALEEASQARPDDLETWQQLGGAYSRRGTQSSDVRYYELAERAFERADEIEPDHPATLIGRGQLALMLHDFDGALASGEQAHEALPAAPEPYAIIVDAEVELGDYDAAAEHLQELLDLRPGLAAFARASYLRELHGDLDGALEAMERAESTRSGRGGYDVATVAALTGDLQFRRGNLDRAEAAYERAVIAQPDLLAAVVGQARVLDARGRTDEAIEQLDELVDRSPEPGAVMLLGHLQSRDGRDEDAEQTYEVVRTIAQLQEASGQDVDLEMAQFEADVASDTDAALDLAERAYDARPDNVYAADVLAWALYRSGDAEAAVEYIEQALRLETADPMLHVHAAAIFEAVGEQERARDELDEAFVHHPSPSYRYTDEAVRLADDLDAPIPSAWQR